MQVRKKQSRHAPLDAFLLRTTLNFDCKSPFSQDSRSIDTHLVEQSRLRIRRLSLVKLAV
jgi:hypothetical protein